MKKLGMFLALIIILIFSSPFFVLASPPIVIIDPPKILFQPFDFSFTIMDPDGFSDLDIGSLVVDFNGLDLSALIIADLSSPKPFLKVSTLDSLGVSVIFPGIIFGKDTSTTITIRIKDRAGQEASQQVTLRAPPPSPPVGMVVERLSVGENTIKDIVLPKALVIAGRVLNVNGIPIPSISINALDESTRFSASSVTDKDGIYRLFLPTGTYALKVFPPFEKKEIALSPIELKKDTFQNITLPNLFLLSGKVTTSRGEALKFGFVSAKNNDRPEISTSTPISKDGFYRVFLPRGIYKITAETPLGLEAPPPAFVEVSAGPPTFVPQGRFPPTITFPTTLPNIALENDRVLNIEVPDVFILSGKISDKRGKPAGAAQVNAQNTETDFSNTAPTNQDGLYVLPLPAGLYKITVTPPSIPPPSPALGLRLPSTVLSPVATIISEVTIRQDTVQDVVLPDGIFLAGRVTDTEGNFVAFATVTAKDPSTGFSGTSLTNEEGLYIISLPPGIYDITVSPGGRGIIPPPPPPPFPPPPLGIISFTTTTTIVPPMPLTPPPIGPPR